MTDAVIRSSTLIVVRALWPDHTWSSFLDLCRGVHTLGQHGEAPVRDFDSASWDCVREAEGLAIERGLEHLYGRFLYEELEQSPNGNAGVTWARAPLDARIRALARAITERAGTSL